MNVEINGIKLTMSYSGLSGMPKTTGCGASYDIECVSHQHLRGIIVPIPRVIRRLAREYLDSAVEIFWRSPYIAIGIKGGLTEERLAAFLAAVTAHCKIK